ncbi:MAG: hypothetical protein HOI95_15805, partial [Chromatiales bacterium]|nr:hypothetical protein [Chromatiales bacterium]
AGTLHGIAGWFRATLAPGVVLNTGPRKPPTHWGQVFFPIGEPVKVRAGGSLHVHFSERIVGSEVRWRWKGTIRPAGGNAALTSFNFHAAREFSELLDV